MYDHDQRTSFTGRGFIPPYVWLAYKQAQRKKDNPEPVNAYEKSMLKKSCMLSTGMASPMP